MNEFLFDLIIISKKSEFIEQILVREEIKIDEKYIFKMMHHYYINFDQLFPNGKSFFTQISELIKVFIIQIELSSIVC